MAVRGYMDDLPLKKLRSYLPGDYPTPRRNKAFLKQILRTPHLSSSIYRYLNGEGQKYVPEMVSKKLGDHWYTGLVRKLSETSLGRNFVLDRVLEKTLPRLGGSTDTARWFMQRGGLV